MDPRAQEVRLKNENLGALNSGSGKAYGYYTAGPPLIGTVAQEKENSLQAPSVPEGFYPESQQGWKKTDWWKTAGVALIAILIFALLVKAGVINL